MNINTLNPIPHHSLNSMCLRCDLANFVPHFSPKKILPPLKHRPSYGLVGSLAIIDYLIKKYVGNACVVGKISDPYSFGLLCTLP